MAVIKEIDRLSFRVAHCDRHGTRQQRSASLTESRIAPKETDWDGGQAVDKRR